MLNLDTDLRVVGYMAVLSDGTLGAFRRRMPTTGEWRPVYVRAEVAA